MRAVHWCISSIFDLADVNECIFRKDIPYNQFVIQMHETTQQRKK